MRLFLFFAVSLMTSNRVLATDQNGVANGIRATVVDERFSLVGVIAEGDGLGKGIAVIRDNQQGKTHTLKIGESIPGQASLVLTKVLRQIVILRGPTSNISVGFNATETGNRDDSKDKNSGRVAVLSGDDEDDDGDAPQGSSGLFEKWYQNRGPAVLNPGSEQARSSKDFDIPSPIRSRRIDRAKNGSVEDADSSVSEEISSEEFDDDAPAAKVEYSDAMRNLIDKYLNSSTPIP